MIIDTHARGKAFLLVCRCMFGIVEIVLVFEAKLAGLTCLWYTSEGYQL
jgi:hypothetical protein